MERNLFNFTDILGDVDEIGDSQISQPLSLPSSIENTPQNPNNKSVRPPKGTGQYQELRSLEEIDPKYRDVFTYPFFNLVQSRVIEDALYSDKSMVVCAPTGSGKTVVFEMAVVQLLMEFEDKNSAEDYKIIYMAPVKALCTERLTEWYSKFTKLGLLCIEVTGDTDVDIMQLQAYKVIITTPEKWDMLTRRWRDHRGLVEMIKLFLIDEVHILNDETRGPVLEAVVSRMKTIQASAQSAHRIEKLQKQYKQINEVGGTELLDKDSPPRIRFVAVSATVSNPEDVAAWLGTDDKPAVYYKFGDECRPVKLRRVVEGYPCAEGTSIFKFDIILNYKLWPIIQKYHDGKPTLIFCNTRKSVVLTAETLSREITITFSQEQQARLTALAATIKNKKFQSLVLVGVGCHHAGMLYEERTNIEQAFRNGDLPILITTTTLAMGVNLPAHLVIIKNTQQYVNGAYQEYSISKVLQMVGRAGRPQYDTEATAVIMTRQKDKARYQALAGGSEPLQSYLHKRLAENLNSETALGTVGDVAQCVEWLRSTFLYVRAAKDPKRYLGLTATAPEHLILKKIEELCVIAMNGLSSAGLISMDEASCITSTEAGRLMSLYYLDLVTMKHIMKIQGNESLERLLWIICESHELSDMHLRTDERRSLNALNRNNSAATIRFPLKGKITTRQMKLSCIIQAVLGCLPIPDPSLYQEAMKIIRIADRVCKCLVAFVTRPEPISQQDQYYAAILNSIILAKCVAAHLWENSPYVSKQLKGIGPTFSTLLATAGKVNFMLLEESHPRDLERIMNKGAPAGNILRKQISMLPKYQLVTTPVDENTVSVKLLLLNQAFLSENLDHLTAGATHKCYVIAGDSENHILMLRTFMDKDLISVYEGNIEYKLRRKHNFEHKIYVNCLSTSFAGIDVHCEYTFTSLMPTNPCATEVSSYHFPEEDRSNMQVMKQSKITSTFKERKRKNCNEEIAQSKEKKKRDNALAEKFKLLKESFGRTSSNLKRDLQKAQDISKNVLNDLTHAEIPRKKYDNLSEKNVDLDTDINSLNDDFMDDARIDSILNEIESEITSTNMTKSAPMCKTSRNQTTSIEDELPISTSTVTAKTFSSAYIPHKQAVLRKRNLKTKSNYNFLDLLEKNVELSDEDATPDEHSGFSETIKSHIDKYILKTHKTPDPIDVSIKELYDKDQWPDSLNGTAPNHYANECSLKNKTIANVGFLEQNVPKKIIENETGKEEFTGNCIGDNVDRLLTDKRQDNSPDKGLQVVAKNLEADFHDFDDGSYMNGVNGSYIPQEDRPESMGNENKASPRNEIILKPLCNNNDSYEVHHNSQHGEESTNFDTGSKYSYPVHMKTITTLPSMNYTLPPIILNDVPSHSSLINQESSNGTVACTNKMTVLPKQDLQIQQELALLPVNEMCVPSVANNSLPLVSPTTSISLPTLKLPIQSVNSNMFSPISPLTNCSKINLKYIAQNEIENTLKIPKENRIKEKIIPELTGDTTKSINIPSRNTMETPPIQIVKMTETCPDNTNKSMITASNNNEYSENFSFSAEKVDIQTKFTNDHKIHVIRKLKVDVDVRKIVTNLDKKDSNYTQEQNINTVKYKKLNDCYEQQSHVEHRNELEYKSETSMNKKFDEDSGNEKSNYKKAIENNYLDLESSLSLRRNKTKENNNEQKTNSVNEKLENIFEKYSKIIGNNNQLKADILKSQSSSELNKSKPKQFKSNRPFKISDIQHVNVPLLPLTSEVSKTPNMYVDISNSNVDPNITNMSYHTNDTLEDRNGYSKGNPHEYIELTPSESPTLSLENTLEISENDLNIDQSMFNPMTLLKSIRNKEDDDEIIPPPPEFGNESTYSSYSPEISNYFNADHQKSKMDYVVEPTECLLIEENHKTNLFEDHSQFDVDLTPSKEIETWTLSRDDEIEDNSSQTPMQYSIMHKNEMFQSTFRGNSDNNNRHNRQGKLSAFKFNRKSKLKL